MSQPPPSTQHHYAGQQGWNDCMPEALLGASKSKGIRRPRRVPSGAATPSNNSSTSLSGGPSPGGPTGPPSHNPSSDSLVTPPPPPASVSPISRPPAAPSSTATEAVEAAGPDAGQILEKTLAQLNEANLPEREASQYKQRFEKIIPDLEAVHLVVIEQVLNDPSSAKDVLIKHSLAHNGISPWMVPLRRIVSVR